MNYKVHLFASIENPAIMQCAGNLYRNSAATQVVKLSTFLKCYLEAESIVCSKCLEWVKANGKIN
jgi:hypothetical protein